MKKVIYALLFYHSFVEQFIIMPKQEFGLDSRAATVWPLNMGSLLPTILIRLILMAEMALQEVYSHIFQ